jgi:LmbE family N-acetylglucosaminyl deacetylase
MSSVLVVATHLDDETLGCGASLIKHKAQGAHIHWILVTEPTQELGYDPQRLEGRERILHQAARMYDFDSIHRLRFPAAQLDRTPHSELIGAMAAVFEETRPTTVYLPFAHDVHTDHQYAFHAAYGATKSFRAPYLKRVLMMETVSETDFVPPLQGYTFAPNVFVDVTKHFDLKLEIMSLYFDQIGTHPFPRSLAHLRALATHRGAVAGCDLAEAFVLLKEIA